MKGDAQLAGDLETRLLLFHSHELGLPGIAADDTRRTLVLQLVDSIHRVRFVEVLRQRPVSERRTQPSDEMFDPLRAAIWHQNSGNIEEAFWLVFLFVHFGRSRSGGWHKIKGVYGRLERGKLWDWNTVSKDVKGFRDWLAENEVTLRRLPGKFGNHRKFESLSATSANGTGAVIESYVTWVQPPRTHQQLFSEAIQSVGSNPEQAFDVLYHGMSAVLRFGRLARFDYLTMIGKLGLADLRPGSTYMQGASGPLIGARLLFGAEQSARVLDQWLRRLELHLQVGMQVLEDALCNWQKSPAKYVRFTG